MPNYRSVNELPDMIPGLLLIFPNAFMIIGGTTFGCTSKALLCKPTWKINVVPGPEYM